MIWVRAAVQAVQLLFFLFFFDIAYLTNAMWEDVLDNREEFGVFTYICVITRAGDEQSTGTDFKQFLRLCHLLHQNWMYESLFACHMIK